MLLNVITFANNSTDSINEVRGSQPFGNHVPLHEQKYFAHHLINKTVEAAKCDNFGTERNRLHLPNDNNNQLFFDKSLLQFSKLDQ
jgi:hypothetical protein